MSTQTAGREVEYDGLEVDDFTGRALANLAHGGYRAVPIGRCDPLRPGLPPHKTPWSRGYHGHGARTATPAEIAAMPARIIARMVRGERGILNLGARLPAGVVGLDVDAYGHKHGGATLAQHEQRLGPLPPTYIVTARPYDSGSGIRLLAVPDDWAGVGELRGGHVDLIQAHLRFVVAPGGLHHTGATYRLHDQRCAGREVTSGVLPARDELPELPGPWCEHLYRTPRRHGGSVGVDDIAAVASEWTFDEHPGQLDKTVTAVAEATGEGQTRPAYHRALWIAARKARAGCYPFSRAVEQIEAAAVAAYAERELGLDLAEFARSIEHAVAEALDVTDAEVTAWGAWGGTT